MEVLDGTALIIRNSDVREGKPVLAGTRMGVHTIVGYYRIYDGDVGRILTEFPHVSREQVEAVLSWYQEDPGHRDEIDALLDEQYAFYDAALAEKRAGKAADRT